VPDFVEPDSRAPDGDDDGGVTLSLQDLPALSAEVRLRVLAGALDPDAPAAPLDLVPADGPDPDGADLDPVEAAATLTADPEHSDDLFGYGDHDVPADLHESPPHDPDPADDDW
jgi:hypothetical protein